MHDALAAVVSPVASAPGERSNALGATGPAPQVETLDAGGYLPVGDGEYGPLGESIRERLAATPTAVDRRAEQVNPRAPGE